MAASTDRAEEWREMRVTARGAEAVKEAGEDYLPTPSGFKVQEDNGRAMYGAYQKRAQFPEIVAPTIRGMIGIIHRTEAQIEMPDAMVGIWEKATADGLALEAFHRRITTELLLTGRYAILADAKAEGSDLPFLAGYSAEALINWSTDRDFYVLDESGMEREEFEWQAKKRYRVLRLADGRYEVETYQGMQKDADALQPTARGGQRLDAIPFVVIGPRDLSVSPEEPSLIGVARAALALCRLDADYRHQLYMSGQETLVIINGDAPEAIGAGVVITLTSGQGEDDKEFTPDAKYVGPTGAGIAAHRQAILDERDNSVAAGARIFDGAKKAAESGEALRLRYAAQTATLTSIAQASAQGLEQALRFVAVMIGADPKTVIVKPLLDFMDSAFGPQEAKALMELWTGGAISYATMYSNFQRGEIASAERTSDEELALIDKEDVDTDPEGRGCCLYRSLSDAPDLRLTLRWALRYLSSDVEVGEQACAFELEAN
ncbi:DUF4055 domain-containing protein [Aureimonas altamirensis]|uniref:DUF4055 domain-containing protein n=1 Tax=Aureimonas altamirensis TaxID=370622 RepID=UPI001E3F3ECA|nr:DUF4055 domain-containing protein [Aureimonas altamirensis]UHD47649.1 DUF4055 domain-containing protein [Aureimonas altamirensis]